MKLFYSPIHAFAHKVLITAYEAGIWDKIESVAVYPFREGYDITPINPYNKVPTLTLDNGYALYGSQAIVEYLDSLSINDNSLYPKDMSIRLDTLRRLALSDTLFDILTQLTLDPDYGEGKREKFIQWLWPKVITSLTVMDKEIDLNRNFDIGDAAQVHALTYLELIVPEYVPNSDTIPSNFDYKKNYRNLDKWFKQVSKRESIKFHYQKPFDGDDSPENCKRHVKQVLELQELYKSK